jgi:hypothetical protein
VNKNAQHVVAEPNSSAVSIGDPAARRLLDHGTVPPSSSGEDRDVAASAIRRVGVALCVGVSALVLSAGAAVAVPGVAEAGIPNPVAGACDGHPDLDYTPSGSQAGQMGEGLCREIITKGGEAAGKAGSAVGRAAKKCAEDTAVGAIAEGATKKGSIWKRAKGIVKEGGKISGYVTAIECAHDIVRG